MNNGDTSDARHYQQVWFAGNHATIGGSGGPAGLAGAPLGWIVEGAVACGLRLGRDLDRLVPPVDAASSSANMAPLRAFYRFLPCLMVSRRGPSGPHELHASARLRAALVEGYRPRSLARVMPGLFRLQ